MGETAPARRSVLHAFVRLDARWFQLVFLLGLFYFGAVTRDFAITPLQIALTFASALLTQAAWQWGLNLPSKSSVRGYLSAIVSSVGISILVRADNDWAHPLLACIAMTSKYTIRAGAGEYRSHVFNPANLAAFLACYVLPGTWLSPGQWGSEGLLALWLLALGGLVSGRVARSQVSIAFLATWAMLLGARLIWLEYDWSVGVTLWLHQLSSGTTLLFAFFMISDPMTTPQSPKAGAVFAMAVAVAAFVWQYGMFKPHGPILMLAVASLAVPLINRHWPQRRFEWSS